MESNTGNGMVVCVTGASGFIASWLVKLLLLRGYTVKGTVRDPSDSVKSVAGCEGVFHTASPVFHNVKDPQTELIDPAVKGTLNVLKSYICRENKLWYALSKTLAEDAAWKFAKENNLDMVALNPTMVIGPLLQPSLNNSSSAISNLINGVQTFPNVCMGWIHVKDVANAHIEAFEISSASGRYCLFGTVAHYSDIVKILHELYPTLQLPEKCADDKPFRSKYQVSKEKAKTLGIEFIPLEVGLRDTVESLKEKKFINL
ncbi:hypothetical protein K1719_041121 [Acacia pycnantha]|nr:hypothetical protein K1719_041121 [Acacia pycnantha]